MTTDTTKAGGADCEECEGRGYVLDGEPCRDCDGTGREPEPEPKPCACYDVRRDGVIYPVMCRAHDIERNTAVGHITYKYQRYFDTEQDAKDRRSILHSMYPSEAYGTSVWIYPIGRWWLVAATYGSAD